MELDKIKELRERSAVGILECKSALVEAEGDIDKALEILRKRGIARAVKKVDREAREGLIMAYVHPGGRIGVLLQLNCETDFVGRTPEFQTLAKDLAMQVAAADPTYLSSEDIPVEVLEKEKEIGRAEVGNKPPAIIEKILQGKLQKYYTQVCLLRQPFIKDEKLSVEDYIKITMAKLGENIYVKRFVRYALGGK